MSQFMFIFYTMLPFTFTLYMFTVPGRAILQDVPPVRHHSTTTMADYSLLDACRRFARTRDERTTLRLVYPSWAMFTLLL